MVVRTWSGRVCCLLVLVLTGCGGNVSIDYDRQIRFADFQSFVLVAKSENSTEDVRLNTPFVERRIEASLLDVLMAKGFVLVEGEADFFVSYQLNLRQELLADTSGVSVGFGTGLGRSGVGFGYRVPAARVESIEKCVLSVDIISATSEELVWRGTGMRSFDRVATPVEFDRLFAELVREILAKFPPAP